MAGINKVIIVGNLGGEPELKSIGNNKLSVQSGSQSPFASASCCVSLARANDPTACDSLWKILLCFSSLGTAQVLTTLESLFTF
jgi:hypothetical protein